MAMSRNQLLKLIELVLVIICVVLHYNSFEIFNGVERIFVASATYGGYLIITIGVTIGYLIADFVPGRRLDLYFSLLGGVLFLFCGYFAWDQYHGRRANDYGLAKAWVSIATGIVYIVDGVFGIRD